MRLGVSFSSLKRSSPLSPAALALRSVSNLRHSGQEAAAETDVAAPAVAAAVAAGVGRHNHTGLKVVASLFCQRHLLLLAIAGRALSYPVGQVVRTQGPAGSLDRTIAGTSAAARRKAAGHHRKPSAGAGGSRPCAAAHRIHRAGHQSLLARRPSDRSPRPCRRGWCAHQI